MSTSCNFFFIAEESTVVAFLNLYGAAWNSSLSLMHKVDTLNEIALSDSRAKPRQLEDSLKLT